MIPNVIQPYTLLIRWGAVLVFVLLLVGAGFKCGRQSGARKAADAEHKAVICGFDRDTLAEALNQVNAEADQAKRDALALANKAADAVKAADKAEEAYERDLAEAERELQRAGKTPACRAQLEAPLCAPLL